ncbi:UNKNOWN [Stylonychia lemnae]|uniref:Uncharacterized protein n=1 Tax=Stylonychia lemnae TaxID=5949 RepID=A0A078BEC4_STYLE|nr:UNKNOWN [Stylonychia lemnae]|eukprot:CDW91492.1 UNKNOWN [Stylonychia lemnae]
MEKFKQAFIKKSKKLSQVPSALPKNEPLPVIKEEPHQEELPSVKVLRPELQSGVSKLQQLNQQSKVKLYDKEFQERFDQSMQLLELEKKKSEISIEVFEELAKDRGNSESSNQLAVIHETVSAMRQAKILFKENEIKDQIIRGNKGILKFIEGDIAKMAVREYESSQNMIKYLNDENHSLKLQNQRLQRENEVLQMDMDQLKSGTLRLLEQVKKQTDTIESYKNKVFSLRRTINELEQMQNHEAIIILRDLQEKSALLKQLKIDNFMIKEKLTKAKIELNKKSNTNLVMTIPRQGNNDLLDIKSYLSLTSIKKSSINKTSREIIMDLVRLSLSMNQANYELTPRAQTPLKMQEEIQFCKSCKDSVKQISQLEVYKAQINTTMISNCQHVLDKANEMMTFYAQYLPLDYFDDEDDDQQSDQLTLKGLFKHLKSTFEETRNTLQRELTDGSLEEDDESNGPQSLNFKSAEKVHQFLMDVIQHLVQNRGQLAQLFKDMQQSYSQLFFYIHYLFDLTQTLIPVFTNYQEFQDIHLKAINKLKSENAWLQSKLQYESYSNKEQQDKIKMFDTRIQTQQNELIDLRSKKTNAEKRVLLLTREMNELLEKLKTSSLQKNEALRDLEQVRRERNYLNELMKELKLMFVKLNQ